MKKGSMFQTARKILAKINKGSGPACSVTVLFIFSC
jgi:hypothetical protein